MPGTDFVPEVLQQQVPYERHHQTLQQLDGVTDLTKFCSTYADISTFDEDLENAIIDSSKGEWLHSDFVNEFIANVLRKCRSSEPFSVVDTFLFHKHASMDKTKATATGLSNASRKDENINMLNFNDDGDIVIVGKECDVNRHKDDAVDVMYERLKRRMEKDGTFLLRDSPDFKLYIVMNTGNTHWSYFSISPFTRNIWYYDPLNDEKRVECITEKHKQVFTKMWPSRPWGPGDEWRVHAVNTPEQANGHDCGVITLFLLFHQLKGNDVLKGALDCPQWFSRIQHSGALRMWLLTEFFNNHPSVSDTFRPQCKIKYGLKLARSADEIIATWCWLRQYNPFSSASVYHFVRGVATGLSGDALLANGKL